MALVWGALWQDFSAGNLVFGFLLALVVVNVFRLPPVELSGRFNVWRAVVFAVGFLGKVVLASFQVFALAVVRGPRVRSAVVGVRLRTGDDLMVTAVGHVLTLIPGSFVVEVDRGNSTLYLHVLDVNTHAQVERVRRHVLDLEARLVRVMGTREEMARVDAERAGLAFPPPQDNGSTPRGGDTARKEAP
ncbi:Na+/H+ antiporter subunit E [Zafaria cholistanensis]